MLPLTKLGIGEEAKLVDIQDGHGIRQRLSVLGLNPGVRITMIQNGSWGPVILGVMDSRIAIGRGMANRIFVTKD
jgi:ferrous iron transport protein A